MIVISDMEINGKHFPRTLSGSRPTQLTYYFTFILELLLDYTALACMVLTSGKDNRDDIQELTAVQASMELTSGNDYLGKTSGVTTRIDTRIDIIENATLTPYYNTKAPVFQELFLIHFFYFIFPLNFNKNYHIFLSFYTILNLFT